MPYANDAAVKALAPFEHLILVNAGRRSASSPIRASRRHRRTARVHVLTRHEQNAEQALQALVDELGAPPAAMPGPRPAADERRAASRRRKTSPAPRRA